MNKRYPVIFHGALLACVANMASAAPAGPPAGYKIDTEYSQTSPDGATSVEQYARENADGDNNWQFWARHGNAMTLLKPEQLDYPADFRFTTNSQWLVRMQKIGSGEMTLYLYRQGPRGFAPATAKPLGDLAWAYFRSRPESHKIMKPDFHFAAFLVKGIDDNYAKLGEKWPDSRYLVISLSGDVLPNRHHGQILSLRGWHCRYDLQTGRFDVPADFAESNAKATAPPSD